MSAANGPNGSQEQDHYRIYAARLRRNPNPVSRHLGSVSFFIPACDLHLVCSWLRDDRGRERVGMPRVRVEAPDGKIHHKTLAHWHSAQSEERFQRLALRALHELIAKS
jgi:hypothetical protein